MRLTPQEIFDKAVGGVLKQGCAGIDPHFGLATITPDGLRCAMGWLAPDNLPRNNTKLLRDGTVWKQWGLWDIRGAIGATYGAQHSLVSELRAAHDTCAGTVEPGSTEEFLREFRIWATRIATNYGLDSHVLHTEAA